MHRLLTFKGYRFKEIPKGAVAYAQAAAHADLKSPEELENEDREAQQAKLQELIRRGTPRDLQAAQELMKSLAGANPEAKPDYRSQTLHELEKLQSKVILLNDLLDNVDTSKGERFVDGDAYDQVATVCRGARPKIQKWIAEASGDNDDQGQTESLDTFLHMNDLINSVLDRYERYKKGDYSAAPLPTSVGGKSDLINFESEDAPSAPKGASSAVGTGGSGRLTDELADLFGPPTTSSAPAPVSSFNLLATSGPSQAPIPSAGFTFNQSLHQPALNNNTPLMPFGTSTPPPGASSSGGANLLGGIALPSTPNNFRSISPANPSPATVSSGSALGAGISRGSSAVGATNPMMQPSQQPQAIPQHPPQPQRNGAQTSGKDPFADLVGLF